MAAKDKKKNLSHGIDEELTEWLEAFKSVISKEGNDRARAIYSQLGRELKLNLPSVLNTDYVNTIPHSREIVYPGDIQLEKRIRSLIRWNAMVMVVRANRLENGIGGHISSYASSANLYEVGFNHFFRGREAGHDRDLVFIQGHASPGIYARAFLEGRLDQKQLINFRRELAHGGGLSSYPHPWLMPNFWEFPTVSMGLGPIMAIYLARFNKYLEDRGLKPKSTQKIWAFLGDGESDEPESLGALTLASREKLDNLIFVVNCNLQRLDGPVRGNGKIIQELESIFRGAGWNVIKAVWGCDWDKLLTHEHAPQLIARMNEVVDGQFQKYTVESGAYIRDHFFNTPELKKMVEHLSDEDLRKLRRGGHDSQKIYSAYSEAVKSVGLPTVILAKTVKGYGMGESGEGKNVTHQQKKMNEDELRNFRSRFGIPISDEDLVKIPFYKPHADSPEMKYLQERRAALGGFVPSRKVTVSVLKKLDDEWTGEFFAGTDGRAVSTTMVFVKILAKLLRDEQIGKGIVPIVSDEARTFGMESMFRQIGIYSSQGQLYEPVDSESLLYYRESVDGQILEEGITEAGALCSVIAAGTSYANHGVRTIPFFIFYSMFGAQRVGDLIWAACDMRTRGFLLGATAGRTTLAGEGLQHQDGHSHILTLNVPNLMCYDPAFAYELAIIIKDGLERMNVRNEDVLYYITLQNENYAMPPMLAGVEDGVLRGLYKFSDAGIAAKNIDDVVALIGSGSILGECLHAKKILEEVYAIPVSVFSATSYKELYKDAIDTERDNLFHAGRKKFKPYVTRTLEKQAGTYIAASDYVKALPLTIAKWVPGDFYVLGTDGFGRSESREALRDFFEVDYRHIVYQVMRVLADKGRVSEEVIKNIVEDFRIDLKKKNPRTS